MKRLTIFALGLVIGAVLTATLQSRYTVVAAGAGTQVPIIHVYRLDRWTGEVVGTGGFGRVEASSIPGWNNHP